MRPRGLGPGGGARGLGQGHWKDAGSSVVSAWSKDRRWQHVTRRAVAIPDSITSPVPSRSTLHLSVKCRDSTARDL